jgi:hypothetical protein
MRATFFVMAVSALSAVEASRALSPLGGLNRRQAFDPDETTRPGANCVEAFGEGYIECVPQSASKPRLCINPDKGETCCDNLWGCPAESFCLIDDLCCPEGLDPATCAKQNDVTLPADFGKTSSAGPSTTATPTLTSSSAVPTGNVSTTRTPTGTGKPPVVTAGAAHEHVGIAAAVLGLAAALVL